MAIVCSDINLLFFCAAKAGSTSISNMLIKNYQGKWLPENHIWDEKKNQILVDYKHSTFNHLIKYNLLSIDQITNLHIVVNTRNPFDWVLSDYLFKLQCYDLYLSANAPDWIVARANILKQTASISFDEYVDNKYNNKHSSVFAQYIDGIEKIEGLELDIVKIEKINDHFATVMSKLGIKNCPHIGHENSTHAKKQDYRNYYTKKSRLIIEKSFAQDIEMLEYQF